MVFVPSQPSGHPEPRVLSVGTRLGAYEIQRHLGAGGYSEVYLVQNVLSGQTLALKVLRESATGDSDAARRVRNEALFLRKIESPHVVRCYEAGITDRRVWFAMEFLDGQTLLEKADGRPMPVAQAVRHAIGICHGVEALHRSQLRVIHRDLKPANVMATRDGRTVLLDLGTAKALSSPELQRSQRLIGTVAYMAPERLMELKPAPTSASQRSSRGHTGISDAVVDERSDLYAIGVILYELVAGRHPYLPEGQVFDRLRMAHDQIFRAARPLSEVAPHVPGVLSELVQRCLAKHPGARPPTVAWLRSALEAQLAVLGEREAGSGPPAIQPSAGLRHMPPPKHPAPEERAGNQQFTVRLAQATPSSGVRDGPALEPTELLDAASEQTPAPTSTKRSPAIQRGPDPDAMRTRTQAVLGTDEQASPGLPGSRPRQVRERRGPLGGRRALLAAVLAMAALSAAVLWFFTARPAPAGLASSLERRIQAAQVGRQAPVAPKLEAVPLGPAHGVAPRPGPALAEPEPERAVASAFKLPARAPAGLTASEAGEQVLVDPYAASSPLPPTAVKQPATTHRDPPSQVGVPRRAQSAARQPAPPSPKPSHPAPPAPAPSSQGEDAEQPARRTPTAEEYRALGILY